MDSAHKEPSQTKQKLDALLATIPIGDEHTEPMRSMLSTSSFACNGAEDKLQAIADAVGSQAYFIAMIHKGEQARINKAVARGLTEHVGKCPLRGVSGKTALLYSFRWPLCIIVTASILTMGGERVYRLIKDRMDAKIGYSAAYNADK